MSGCCGPAPDGRYSEIFDERFASSIARRYRRRGLTAPEGRIIEALSGLGLRGTSVLEVGGGIGELQLELLARGAAETVNLELSDAYEEQADELMRSSGVDGRVTRIVGVDLAAASDADVARADYVLLHRVICCYPDFAGLLGAAADHARSAVVFSHPARNLFTRAVVAMSNARMAIAGHDYRGFVHSPEAMLGVLSAHGLALRTYERSKRWHIAVAVREPAPAGTSAVG
ncbi:methyltransferase domain-containing protein [Agromyces sp. NPDC004153]